MIFLRALPAEAYQADAITGPDILTLHTNLFTSSALMTHAPVGHWIWFVADVNLDGVPTSPSPGNLLGADDQLIFADTVDGTLLGNQDGRYRRANITVPDVLSNANIAVYLWDVPSSTAAGAAGHTFGLLNLGVVAVPGIGNAAWLINTPIFADTFQVSEATQVVPEPSTLLLSLGGALVINSARRKYAAAK